MFSRIIASLFIFCFFQTQAQQDLTKKELLDLLDQKTADTTLLNVYNELIWPVYCYDMPDSSIFFATKAIDLAKKTGDIKRLSITHRRLGITYLTLGDFKKAILHEEESYRLSEKINFEKGMQLALNNIGVAYLNNELFNKALSYFLKSLAIVETTKDYSSAAKLYANCGRIYGRIADHHKSKQYFIKALSLAKTQNDKDLLVMSYCDVSAALRNLKQIDSCNFYLKKAAAYLDAQSQSETKYTYYLNLGLFYSDNKQNNKALDSFLSCVPFITNPNTAITLYINIADENKFLGNKNEALKYYNLAYDISLKNKTYNNLEFLSRELAKIYEEKKEWNLFREMMNLHLVYNDSNLKVNAVQQIQRQQLEFDFERKRMTDSLRFAHRESLKTAELALANASISRQKTFALMLIAIIVAIVALAVFIFNRFVIVNRQKKIIELQKQIVDIKNKEIRDSINYAKRLQSAILPQLSDIKQELDFDLLYIPKDIIGGDFYFFEKYNGFIFLAVCDCTGHGIPGAMMSVVCHQALQKSIKEYNQIEPGHILNKTRELIVESLNAAQQNINDGMDCSLLVIEKSTNKISWAGANNPIWIVDNQPQTGNNSEKDVEAVVGLYEIKADKQPVAFYENNRSFTTHLLPVNKGCVLYLFTDGYADQFGGSNGKKYKNKSLKLLLTEISGLPADTQVSLMYDNFSTWKKNLDQVDDIAVAVLKI
jgi:serine phosphatase RsbU (regulator of sigma subunit)